MTCMKYILCLHKVCFFQTKEGAKIGLASNSEIKRWFKQKCVEINFIRVAGDDPMPPALKSVVLFPTNKKQRTTLFYDNSFSLLQVDENVLLPSSKIE